MTVSTLDRTAALSTTHSDVRRADGSRWLLPVAYFFVPLLIMALTLVAGYLKYQDGTARDIQRARAESLHAATTGAIALLSYRFDTAEKDLTAAMSRMTDDFRDSYTRLIHDVVIPGAAQKHISVSATIAAAASVSATPMYAVVLVFINQSLTQGNDPATATRSIVRMTLDKQHGKWLISEFEPV